jgi:hypothetical protein
VVVMAGELKLKRPLARTTTTLTRFIPTPVLPSFLFIFCSFFFFVKVTRLFTVSFGRPHQQQQQKPPQKKEPWTFFDFFWLQGFEKNTGLSVEEVGVVVLTRDIGRHFFFCFFFLFGDDLCIP